jgi:hypothetical protein
MTGNLECLGVKKGNGRNLHLNVQSWYRDEEIGASGVHSVGCKICRCGRSLLVSKMIVFGHVGYLFDEDNKCLKLSVSISSLLESNNVFYVCVCIYVRRGVYKCECEATLLL